MLFNRSKTIETNDISNENKFTNTQDNELLNKLRDDISELKKLNPKEPCLRHTLNDFLLKRGYSRIPSHMRLFEDFFSVVDRDYRHYFSASRDCKEDELDCVIKILQNFKNEVSERYDLMKRESELKEEIALIKKTLEIE
jgi:hypothetical protein